MTRRSPIKLISIFFSIFLLVAVVVSSASAQSSTSLTVHDIQAKPQSDQFAYDISVFFSLYDSTGAPVQNLVVSDVTLTEDGKRVDPIGLEAADREPINVAIVVDTSGSMAGIKMDAAKRAAASFLSTLQSGDQAALISFNSDVKTEADFTDNLSGVREKVQLLDADPRSGTCFFDALYNSIQLSASIPNGRRAIVILTDGKDELPNGGKCSKYTDQDVIDLANSGTTRVPIYTLGLGNSVDAKGLERLAALTGGLYQFAAAAGNLDQVFESLGKQLRSQYRLTYVSIAAPGPHVLALKVDTNSIHQQDSRDFLLQPFPYRISFITPADGEKINEETKLSAQISGQGEPIAKVEFFANGKSLGIVKSPPYELVWTPSFGGTQTKLEVAAFGEAGGELARSSINVIVGEVQSAASTSSTAEPSPSSEPSSSNLILIGLVALAILVIVVAVIAVSSRRKRLEQQRDREWLEKVQSDAPAVAISRGEERTMDSFLPSDNALGMLVVLQSDDPVMVGQRIEIAKAVTNLGRKADNDVIFTQDAPVSRHHAVIEERSGNLFLSEVIAMDEGAPKRPAYGTFVNGTQIEDPVLLHDGDEIRLGKRVRLRFESVRPASTDDERTMDQFDSGDERTMDLDS